VDPRRVRTLKGVLPRNGPVVYWMSRDQRVHDNWALIFAQEIARKDQVPLAVVFCLVPEFLNASIRQYGFLLKGMADVERGLRRLNIAFFLLRGDPGIQVPHFLRQHDAGTLITDFDPLQLKQAWKVNVSSKAAILFQEVDAHNIVPCWIASPKIEYGAYTLRPKLKKYLYEFFSDFPILKHHSIPWPAKVPTVDWLSEVDDIGVDRSVPEITWLAPGEAAARKTLRFFLKRKLSSYAETRNDPTKDGQSNLSPYLHFGHLSAQRVMLEVLRSSGHEDSKDAFLEELIVRRELSDNFCFYQPHYNSPLCFPAWAHATLEKHRHDRRVYQYSAQDLEEARTHDDLWNAAQQEMRKRGKMHGYLRMYWAKKILEWTSTPEQAMKIAIYLNDRYELDGRDPNGYTGIAWSIGGVHDRAWNERPIFGKIRFMSYRGCRSKFNVDAYIEHVKAL